MAVKHETELYAPLKAFFEERGYEIKGEVRHCDLVGFHPEQDQPLIVEMKKSFNLPLLLQGVERQKLSSEVYLAVERTRAKKGAHNQRWSDITNLCRRLGLGFITITQYKTKPPFVEIHCLPGDHLPAPSQRIVKTRAARLQYEFKERSGDYNIGGSHGTKLMTAYREKALRVAMVLQEGGEMAPKDIKALSGIGQAATILQKNYYHWFRRVSRGRYVLTSEGEHGLKQYSHIIDGWRNAAPTAEK